MHADITDQDGVFRQSTVDFQRRALRIDRLAVVGESRRDQLAGERRGLDVSMLSGAPAPGGGGLTSSPSRHSQCVQGVGSVHGAATTSHCEAIKLQRGI